MSLQQQIRNRSRSPRKEGKGDTLVDDTIFDGKSAAQIFENPKNRMGFAFDDLIMFPRQINFGVQEISLETQFTKRIRLNLPLVSSPMDTVTESKMAIGLALEGGIGVIHRNLPLEEQVNQVVKVKKFKNGFITDPICISPTIVLSELDKLREQCGFTGFPVTANGKIGSQLLGLVTRRDTDFVEDRENTRVSSIMTKLEDLVVANEGIGLQAAHGIIEKEKKGKLPIVSKTGLLVALIARTDLKKSAAFPLAAKDYNNSLVVAAAVGASAADRDRVAALAAANVDALVVDSTQGDNMEQHEMIRWIKANFPAVDVVGGNVVTRLQAKHLIDCGVDALRVGMGVGSISTSQSVKACGRAQASAVYHVSKLAMAYGVPVIADGGVGSPGHIIKALCVGANSVMCGRLLAGTEEAPGEYVFAQNGVRVKTYRGTGSLEAMKKSPCNGGANGINSVKVALGVSGAVQEQGSLRSYLPYLAQGVKHGLQDMGVMSVKDLRKLLHAGELRFELRSAAAQREGDVHGLHSFERKLFST